MRLISYFGFVTKNCNRGLPITAIFHPESLPNSWCIFPRRIHLTKIYPCAPNSTAVIALFFYAYILPIRYLRGDRLLRLYIVFYEKNHQKTTNAMKAYRSAYSIKCAARTMIPTLYCSLIARWRHGFLLYFNPWTHGRPGCCSAIHGLLFS